MNTPQITIDRWFGGKKAAVALTFDDWTPGHALVALPLLNKMQLQATFFVTLSNFRMRPNEDHWLILQQLKSAGHEVGNHTQLHSDLCTLTPAKLFAETTYAREQFDDQLLGKPVNTFAYPFGRYNKTVINEVKKNHIAARAYSEKNDHLLFDYQFAEDEDDYYKIPCLRLNAKSNEADLGILLEKYIDNNGFLACVFHGIFNDSHADDHTMFDAIHEEKLTSLMKVIKNKNDEIWVVNFGKAVSYHRFVKNLYFNLFVIDENTLKIDFYQQDMRKIPDYFSISVGLYNGKIPISVRHQGKPLFVNYTENGIRLSIDGNFINDPLFIYYS